jgi:hypothetical protein
MTSSTSGENKDGQIAEAWNNFDFLKLFQQIGAV